MTDEQTKAYAALCETGERLQGLIANARSILHPLKLSTATLLSMRRAVNEIHDAQRIMEKEQHD
jgi:hypothetical protein